MLFDRIKYWQRSYIEHMFDRLNENRRIVTRFDTLAKSHVLTGLYHAVFGTSCLAPVEDAHGNFYMWIYVVS